VVEIDLGKLMMRTENFPIAHQAPCLVCGKIYVPLEEARNNASLDVPNILLNNFCSRACYDKAGDIHE
jgi:hypothetical protein